VHLPLSIEAQVEAMTLMMSTNNIFSPANGSPIISPTQDIVMGSYYLTVNRPGERNEGMIFSSPNEVFLAFSQGDVGVHAMIKLRLPPHKKLKGEGEKEFTPGTIIKTTVGRVIFNDILPRRCPTTTWRSGRSSCRGSSPTATSCSAAPRRSTCSTT
jgi:DNA-directed RNA polymerase subunit beta'